MFKWFKERRARKKRFREAVRKSDAPRDAGELDAILRQQEADLKERKYQAAGMVHKRRELEQQRDEYLRSALAAGSAAKRALGAGDEESARHHLTRKQNAEKQAEEYGKMLEAMESNLNALKLKIEEMQLEIDKIKSEHRANEMRQSVAQIQSGFGSANAKEMERAHDILAEQRDSVLEAEAIAEVRGDVRRSGVEEASKNLRVEEELERLRRELSGSSGDDR